MLNEHRTSGRFAAALLLASAGIHAAPASAQEIVGLITKTNTNPFFVKMKEGADARRRKELGWSCAPSPESTTATTRRRSRRSRI